MMKLLWRELEGFWSSAILQGSPDKIMYDEHSLFDLENSEKLKANWQTTHARAEISLLGFWTLSLTVKENVSLY